MQVKTVVLLIIVLFSNYPAFSNNFPHYVEMNVGETVTIEDFPSITLISKKVTYRDPVSERIGAAQATLQISDQKIVIPVGYEHNDVIVDDIRLGVEVISDYEFERINDRFHLTKDARIRISRAGEPLMLSGTHVYPLFTPWNNGARTQGWLTICCNINSIEGSIDPQLNRHHDGYDFGTWEGQLVRSVCRGIVVSPDDYPELIEKKLLYNKNNAPISGNPFLVKHPDLPLLYYFTHLSGLARHFKKGDIIKKGQVLGYASARGSSGGWYHLHFGIILIDQHVCVNPYPFLVEWYKESMPHYSDFLSDFDVYYSTDYTQKQLEEAILNDKIESNKRFHNSLPGVVHLREAVADAPYSGLNHVVFDQFAVLKGEFISDEEMMGELWFGHTGKARLYLNGKQIYSGENKNPYHRSVQPLQVDSQMLQCQFAKGVNYVIIAMEQTNVFWEFSLRPRTRLGLPLQKSKETN